MDKIVLKLSDILKTLDTSEFGLGEGSVTMSVLNVDDIFGLLMKKGIKEVKVNFGEMFMITIWTIANIQNYNGKNETNWQALKLIKDGKINKFFGIRLYLYE